ncbi:transport Sec24B, partial [Paramuricea clavata]
GPPTPSSQAGAIPGSKRRVYPTQSYNDNTYQTQGYTGTPSPTQPTSTGAYGAHMGTQGPGVGLMPNMAGANATPYMNNQYGSNQSNQLQNQMGKLSVQQTATQAVNLLDGRNMLPPQKDDINSSLTPDMQKKNARANILCCTLSNVPENDSLLKKCKLPFGILVHPFKDLSNLAVIQSSTIVRCRSCRTYINPFVTFTESRRWRCNMCYRINEVPEEFCYDPTTKSYGEPTRRPEIKSATYEFIAPSEYMLRAPQPAAYVFAFDVSFNAIETGYLKMACELIKDNLDKMPGDSRALIGFLTFNKSVNFYNLRNDQSQPHMLIVSDIDDIFLPAPEDLLVNLKENKEMIIQFLDSLPETFASTRDIHSATGAAMQAALKLMTATGGRITIFQTTLPSVGPGALENRDEPGVKSNPKDTAKLNPATDFYKKLALDCAADQVSVDIFQLSSQYADCSSLMCAAKYSGGCFSYFPNFHISRNRAMVEKFENDLVRYITRKIGFEAVMRVRCTKGLSIHTFHGNFFVRSTDLLSLPNVNPDSAFGMQISIEDNLTDVGLACFQSALLYTSSRGERRIRVHNLALPVTKKMNDVYAGANASAIALMLSKMAVDRTLTASLGDAREALLNAVVDCLGVYKSVVSGRSGEMIAPNSLKYLPLYILSLLKQTSFRLGSTANLDTKCYEMQQLKVMPFDVALLTIYPALYSLHDMTDEGAITTKSGSVPQPPRLILSGEKLSRVGIFLMDAGQEFYIWVGKDAAHADIQCLFGVANYESIPEDMGALPILDNSLSSRVRALIDYLQSERTNHANLYILRDNSKMRMKFITKLMNDRTESMMSYHEFLIHIQGQIN